jgi:hypothetical protein
MKYCTINWTNSIESWEKDKNYILYPLYTKDTNLDAHIEVFKCIIIVNEETNNYHIVNMF